MCFHINRWCLVILLSLCARLVLFAGEAVPSEWVEAAKDGKGFVLSPSGRPFTPWGFNYDRDSNFRLIEDYWSTNWAAVERDFGEMKHLGANVVRIHLQFARFMKSPSEVNESNLERLRQLVDLAEKDGLYLDITGLGCYRKQDIPGWYDALPEQERWAAQARFWEEIARVCADRPAVWCYDLMNEPIVSDDKRNDWLWHDAFANLYYIQYVNLDPAGRGRLNIARQWTRKMVGAIRKYDRRHLITIGLAMIEIGLPENAAGFGPAQVGSDLDFISVHIFPEVGKFGQWTDIIERSAQGGKPVVIEEIYPLRCDAKALGSYIERTRGLASGWIGFYWGKTPGELSQSTTRDDQLTLQWLDLFQRMNPNHQ
jgi:Cellulase (glycosyl hydrolase family 5)